MINFFTTLRARNPLFYYLGIGYLLVFLIFLIGFALCNFEIALICHWIKPFKFSLSFALYFMTLGWFMEYLKGVWGEKKIKTISQWLALLILFEMIVILLQSALSYTNMMLYHLANLFILLNTALLIYIAAQFFRNLSLKPISYLWSIRASFLVFIVSSMIGMYLVQAYGPMLPDNKHFGLPFSQLSSPRQNLISLHFIGLHFLQALPLCCYYLKRGKTFIFMSVFLYLSICLIAFF